MSRPVEVVAVLGAGTMGRGIAHVAALGGFETRLYDVDSRVLESARATIHANLAKGVDLGKVEPAAADRPQLSVRPPLAA